MDYKELMKSAQEARKFSYTQYSHFKVGAALLTESGEGYAGYTPTNCAERTAIFKAVSEGETEFEAIAVVGGRDGETSPLCAPCGVCRQVIAEFCDSDFKIILGTEENYSVHTLSSILPYAFGKKDL